MVKENILALFVVGICIWMTTAIQRTLQKRACTKKSEKSPVWIDLRILKKRKIEQIGAKFKEVRNFLVKSLRRLTQN